MQFDLTLKELFFALPQTLFRHLCGAEIEEIQSVEVSTTSLARRPDLFGKLAGGPHFHGELQSTPEPDMPWRMLGYRWFFWQQMGIEDVVQIVFALRGRPAMPAQISKLGLSFQFQVVDFTEIDSALLARGERPEELVLSVLCRGGTEPDHIRRVLRRCLESPPERRDVLVRHLQVLSGLRPGLDQTLEKELSRMPVTIDLRDNSMFRKVYEEGREEGRDEGREEGREQGMRDMVVSLLEKRFGPLPTEKSDLLQAASAPALARILSRILDATTLEAAFE